MRPRIFTNLQPVPLRLDNAVALAHAMLAASPMSSEAQIDNACLQSHRMTSTSYYGVGEISVEQIKETLLSEFFEEQLHASN